MVRAWVSAEEQSQQRGIYSSVERRPGKQAGSILLTGGCIELEWEYGKGGNILQTSEMSSNAAWHGRKLLIEILNGFIGGSHPM